MLPPLPIHCIALDGESTTMPVIFEDQYQDPFDYKRTPFENSTTSTYGNFLMTQNLQQIFTETIPKLKFTIFLHTLF